MASDDISYEKGAACTSSLIFERNRPGTLHRNLKLNRHNTFNSCRQGININVEYSQILEWYELGVWNYIFPALL